MAKKSRAKRFAAVIETVSQAREELEELTGELQDWLDGMPDNLQDGSKADELNEAISQLEDLTGQLGEIEMEEVDFPGMIAR